MPPQPSPRFTVIVPTYQRPSQLRACLDALASLRAPAGGLEVVVVDDGSESVPELPVDLVESLRLQLVRQPHRGPAAARNAGAAVARGSVLVFTDDDCRPTADWLVRLAEAAEAAPGAMIGGAVTNALVTDPYAAATQTITGYVFEYRLKHQQTGRFFATNNLLVPAERFRELRGFDERFPTAAGEDYDFCARWQEAGWPAAVAPEAVVEHAHGHQLRSFWRQHFQYGRALLRVRRGMARRAQQRLPSLEAPRYYAGLLLAGFRRREAVGRWRLTALVALSQAATVVGAVRELLQPAAGSGTPTLRGH